MFQFMGFFAKPLSIRAAQTWKPTAGTTPLGAHEVDFRLLTENSTDVICRRGPNHSLTYVSPSAKQVLGWSPEEMMAGGVLSFVHPDDVPLARKTIARLDSGEAASTSTVARFRRGDGTFVWIETNARKLRDGATGKLGDTVLVMRDISDRKRLEAQLEELARTDALTGLANRRAFDEALEREWRRTMREGSPMSLLILDLDRFKQFNDLYGHQAGDDCLRVVSSAIRAAVRRPGDLVARYGGEELAVILPVTDAEGAKKVAEDVRLATEAIGLPHAGNPDGAYFVTLSIGAATAFSRAGGTMTMPEGLLMAADGALYKAKHDGRNRVATTLLLVPCEPSESGNRALVATEQRG